MIDQIPARRPPHNTDVNLRLDEIVNALLLMVGGLEDEELQDAVGYLGALSMTNCWCSLYWCGPSLLKLVQEEIADRARLAAAPSIGDLLADPARVVLGQGTT